MNILEVEHLSKAFAGDVLAVDDLSFTLAEGEFVTLLGPSGCGKTTVLRMIAGFESPDRGRILLGGQDVTDLPPYRRQVNTVFQDYALFPHMTVAQNVGYGLRIAGVRRGEAGERVRASLAMVELLDKADSRPHQLSGGQRQRVALARAIIRHPKVLLLDEPLSALDVKLREAMQVELKHLHQKLGITFILVTHDQKEALVMSDRVFVMERGRIMQTGTPTELYERPNCPYVADFVGTSNLLPASILGIEDGRYVAAVGDNRLIAMADGRDFAAGDRVVLAVRPEKAALRPASGAGARPGELVGTVLETLFHGNSLRIKLDLGGGLGFALDLPLAASLAEVGAPASGQRIALAIDPGNVILFPEERP